MMSDQLFDDAAERALLGALIHDARMFFDVKDTIGAPDFFILRNQYVFAAIVRMAGRGHAIDIVSLSSELRTSKHLDDIGGAAYLADCMAACANPRNAEEYARRVRAFSYKRRMLSFADHVKAIASRSDVNIQDMQSEIERALTGASLAFPAAEPRMLADDLGEMLDYLGDTENMPAGITGLSTGLRDWDDLLDGFQGQSFNLIGARPSMGKTSLLMDIAAHIALQGKPVYFLTMEMPSAQLARRFTSSRTGISGNALRAGLRAGGLTSTQYIRVVQFASEHQKTPLIIDDTPSLTPSELQARVNRIMRRMPLGAVIIDYVQLMSVGGVGESRVENRVLELSYISRALKKLAMSIGAPVIAAAQLSRALENRADKRPVLSDLRESGSLEQDADTVTFIYRDVVYNPLTDAPNKGELILRKNRHGAVGTATVYFDASTTSFKNAQAKIVHLNPLMGAKNESA